MLEESFAAANARKKVSVILTRAVQQYIVLPSGARSTGDVAPLVNSGTDRLIFHPLERFSRCLLDDTKMGFPVKDSIVSYGTAKRAQTAGTTQHGSSRGHIGTSVEPNHSTAMLQRWQRLR